MPIHFEFELDKFIACVAIMASRKLSKLDKLKICKLLYYVDKYHLHKYGKPITGDTYVHMDNGPVPSKALDIMNEVILKDQVTVSNGVSNKAKFSEFLKVKKSVFHRYPVFELVKNPKVDVLSESELEAVGETIKIYGNFSGGQLIDKTHKDAAWLKTNRNEEIDYRSFFVDTEDASPGALEYLESLQEDLNIKYYLNNK